MHILIAPNAFKNSCTAAEAASAIARGLRSSKLSCTVECFPVADGGDGTGELLVSTLKGKRIEAEVKDPLGRKISSGFGLINNDKTAVIEMADASGIKLLKRQELDPLHASSFGTGELILRALDLQVDHIVLCIGGSATVDGGTGILSALGIQFKDKDGHAIAGLPERLVELHRIDRSLLDERLSHTTLTILCDVDNPLLGRQGAAAVFGPQKGANPEAVEKLERSLKKWKEVVKVETGKNIDTIRHGGAAGGTAAGLYGLLDAELVQGVDYFLGITAFDNSLLNAHLVITGEGSIDSQTLQGKAPYGVAKKAKENGKPVIGFSGRLPVAPEGKLYEFFDVLLSITNSPVMVEKAMHDTLVNLERTAREMGNLLSIQLPTGAANAGFS